MSVQRMEEGARVRYVGEDGAFEDGTFEDGEELEILQVDDSDDVYPYLVYSPESGFNDWVSADEVEPW